MGSRLRQINAVYKDILDSWNDTYNVLRQDAELHACQDHLISMLLVAKQHRMAGTLSGLNGHRRVNSMHARLT